MAAGAAAGSPPKAKPAAKDSGRLVVHEWGTFLSVQGSDGNTLGGMVDSEEALPPFVEARNIQTWQRSLIREKMETPVTYFYTDRPRDVKVLVSMPKGILTHWFPSVRHYGPDLDRKTASPVARGYLDWQTIHLIPSSTPLSTKAHKTEIVALKNGKVYTGIVMQEDKQGIQLVTGDDTTVTLPTDQIAERRTGDTTQPAPALPKVDAAQTWQFARETDSAYVRVNTWDTQFRRQTQLEKFLFYRGLGQFTLGLAVEAVESCKRELQLTLLNRDSQRLRSLFLVQVENGTLRFAALGDLDGRATRTVQPGLCLSAPLPLSQGVPEAKRAVAEALVACGLYRKEALAMVNTWEKSYFRSEGLRVLSVLPREVVDGVIPIQIKPAADELIRVMVGRVEILTPQREREIEQFVTKLGAKEYKVRQAASLGLAKLGRITEPVLRRVIATSNDPEVRSRAETLIKQVAEAK
jgi:hypothetical protein